jgi:hypothetical protein
VFTLFTSTSDLAASVVGPLVCPGESTPEIETSTGTYVDENGVPLNAATREIVCVDHSGSVVSRPAPLPGWIWAGLVTVAAVVVCVVLAAVLAAPAGVLVGGLIGRLKQ